MREIELERRLLQQVAPLEEKDKNLMINGNIDALLEPGEDRSSAYVSKMLEIDKHPEYIKNVPLVYLAEQRLEDVQKQLEASAMSEQDLLLELDSVVSETKDLKKHIAELNSQLENNHLKLLNHEKMNFTLSSDLIDTQKKLSETTVK